MLLCYQLSTMSSCHRGCSHKHASPHYPAPACSQVDVLDSVVADACTQVDHHLMEVITTRFHFARHCDVLRRYLLLGQGDYVQALLELVGAGWAALLHVSGCMHLAHVAAVSCSMCSPVPHIASQPCMQHHVCTLCSITFCDSSMPGAEVRDCCWPLQVEPVSAAQATDLLLGDLLKQAISSISPPAEDEEVLDLLMARKAQATGGHMELIHRPGCAGHHTADSAVAAPVYVRMPTGSQSTSCPAVMRC